MAPLTFADHQGFQRSVLWASLAAVGAGGLVAAATALGLPVPGAALACAAVAAAACGRGWRSRVVYGLVGGLLGLAPLAAPAHPNFALAVSGAGLGVLMAHSRRREVGAGPSVGRPRPGRAAFATSAGLTALLMVAGSAVVQIFESRQLLEYLVPGPLATALQTGVMGFFVSLGGAGAHLVRDPDPVELLYASLQPDLRGDLQTIAGQAMTNYRRCAEILAGSPPSQALNQVSKSLSEMTTRILELGRRWIVIDRELGERAEGEIAQRLIDLKALKDGSKDEVAKRQLGVAEAALQGELEQIDRIRRGRERVVARLHGEMALLERARFALLSLKSSDAHLRTAELAALSESMSLLAREMDSEAQAVDELISQVVDVKDTVEARDIAERVKAG